MSVAYELDLDDAAPGASAPAYALPCGQPSAVPVPGRRSVPTGPRRLAVVPDATPRNAPGTAHRGRVLAPAAPIAMLRPLDDPSPLRLTRRGIVVLALAVAALGVGLVALAALCAPAASAPASRGPAVVTVRAGDTLWSIASAAAPNVDPAAEVAAITRLNHLHSAELSPGEHLRVR